ncbi:hypothetical protein PY247_18210 [Acinetobacter proteolyticus]|nr:hypothetical protein [Acinetobacter proteolyticus]WEI18181.1 hypothetical protein PY247_18210 [Acinetobacter proteolyticus]
MKVLNPIAKGIAERQRHRLEKFKIEFSATSTFDVLNSQFPPMEIFEMNNGKFSIPTVQQAYQEWRSELKPTKRKNFIKDLDKLLSDDYVLVPKQPDAAMEKAGMEAGGGFLAIHIFKTMCAAAQGSNEGISL